MSKLGCRGGNNQHAVGVSSSGVAVPCAKAIGGGFGNLCNSKGYGETVQELRRNVHIGVEGFRGGDKPFVWTSREQASETALPSVACELHHH